MVKYYKLTARTLLVFAFICMALLLVLGGCKRISKARASAAFRRYVLNPIPKSVTNIRADKPMKIHGYRYTFRFNINRDDLGLLINSRPFVRAWNVKYKNRILSWYFERGYIKFGIPMYKYGSSMAVYKYTREPGWFTPGLWDNPEAYAFCKYGDLVNIQTFVQDTSGPVRPVEIRVLLYNEKEGQAYYVVQFSEN